LKIVIESAWNNIACIDAIPAAASHGGNMSEPIIPDRFHIEQQARELRRAELARLAGAATDAILVAAERSVVFIARALRRMRLAQRDRAMHAPGRALAH
jgi:hypothetical protein